MTTYHVKIIRCDADKTQEACSNTRRRPDGQRLRVDNIEAIQWGDCANVIGERAWERPPMTITACSETLAFLPASL